MNSHTHIQVTTKDGCEVILPKQQIGIMTADGEVHVFGFNGDENYWNVTQSFNYFQEKLL